MNHHRPIRTVLFLVLVVLTPCAPDARAAPPEALSERVPDITVTAERLERERSEVALSVTAVTGEELREAGIESTLDLQQLVAGPVFSTNTVLGQPYLRGIGTEILGVGADPSVSVYVDGVYHSRPVSSIRDFYDLERIELLKGPQGALYGRNTTGGSIRLFSMLPTSQPGAEMDVLYGSYRETRARGFVNVPIDPELALLRVSFLRHYHDGYSRNSLDDSRVDEQDTWSYRGQLQLTPSDELRLLLRSEYSSDAGSRNMGVKVDTDFFSPAVDVFGGAVPSSDRTVLLNSDTGSRVLERTFSGALTWTPGSVTVKSTTAYRSTDLGVNLDLDATDADFAWDKPDEDSSTFTQDLHVYSELRNGFNWLFGSSYLRESGSQEFPVVLPLVPLAIRTKASSLTRAWAAFAEVGVPIRPTLRLVAALRFS